ncbi:unnamed protein product, partial [Ectocarpus sp. 8 AP-2014]
MCSHLSSTTNTTDARRATICTDSKSKCVIARVLPCHHGPMREQYYPSSLLSPIIMTLTLPLLSSPLLSVKKHVNTAIQANDSERTQQKQKQSVFLSKTEATMEHVKRASTP